MSKLLISIVGPTGIGKTKLAIEVATYFGTEILSCDSRQFFKEMPIGTAMPSEEERKLVSHHFIANLGVKDEYSIGKYEKDALNKIENLFQKYDQLVLVGGSGMYEKAVIEGLDNLPEACSENIYKLEKILQTQGISALQKLLQDVDIERYRSIDLQNPRRLMRALDIYMQTKKTYSELLNKSHKKRNFTVLRIGIRTQRDILYQRINQRVDEMMQKGLMEEVRGLIPFRNNIALKTVGYTELFRYLDGEWNLDFAVDEIKKNSRRYAKRQFTWYNKSTEIRFIPMEYTWGDLISIFNEIC